MITIRHTQEAGTVVEGSTKGDGVWEIAKPLGWRFHRDVGIYLRGSRDQLAKEWKLNALADACSPSDPSTSEKAA